MVWLSVPESPGLKAQGKKIKFLLDGSSYKPNGGQAKQNGHQKSQHRTQLKHTHKNLAVLIRDSLKYKNTVSQKTFYKDTELQIQVLTG